MRIVWNESEGRFQAEFSDFHADLDAVKTAGFKTAGPPSWVWHTSRASVLNALKSSKPSSGLTITQEALEKYKSISEQESKKAEIKRQFETAKKAAKKVQAENDPGMLYDYTAKGYVTAEDLPPSTFVWNYKPPVVEHEICFVCDGPVYFYEKLKPTPICLWCEIESSK